MLPPSSHIEKSRDWRPELEVRLTTVNGKRFRSRWATVIEPTQTTLHIGCTLCCVVTAVVHPIEKHVELSLAPTTEKLQLTRHKRSGAVLKDQKKSRCHMRIGRTYLPWRSYATVSHLDYQLIWHMYSETVTNKLTRLGQLFPILANRL